MSVYAARAAGARAAFLFLLTWASPVFAQPADVTGLIERHGFSPDQVGVHAEALDGGELVLAHNADRAFPPGSVAKLLTAVGVLEALGPDHRFATELFVRRGDGQGRAAAVALRGGGDPALDVNGLFRLALDLRAAGVREADALVVDDGVLPRLPRLRPDQPAQDGYNTGLGALSLAFNRAQVREDGKGEFLLPPLRETNPAVARWRGGEPARDLPIEDVGVHAAFVFRDLASRLGVRLPPPERGEALPGDTLLAAVGSLPLRDLVHGMLLHSNNQSAEILGLAATGERSLQRAAAAVMASLHDLSPEAGLNRAFLPNLSGLAPEARLTPRQAVAVLRSGERRHGLLSLLPASGWSGSLADRLDDRNTALRVWAKTGSLDYAAGLAGVALPEGGPPILFAVMAFDEEARARLDAERASGGEPSRVAASAWQRRARALQRDLIGLLLSSG